MKYRPDFPDRFGSEEHARAHCRDFFPWYNTEHHHSGIGFFTPHDVHYGLAEAKRAQRSAVLEAAYRAHPERFPHGLPALPPLSHAVWINKPAKSEAGAAPAEPAEERAPHVSVRQSAPPGEGPRGHRSCVRLSRQRPGRARWRRAPVWPPRQQRLHGRPSSGWAAGRVGPSGGRDGRVVAARRAGRRSHR